MTAAELADRLLAGDRRALARALTWIEGGAPAGRELIGALYAQAGRAQIVGVTGPPGTGKSTLVNQMARAYRRRDQSVGIVAVDPSSPFSGGALLGDRIRMQDLAGDPGIFLRSMATRGALGGLASATADVVTALDAFGKDVVIVETVGVGQDEIDIVRTAHTTLVVGMPGMGDDVQAIKAGILEIADIYVVNKADKEGVDRLVSELKMLLTLAPERSWKPPILKTVASAGEGIDEVIAAIDRHRTFLQESGEIREQEIDRARGRVLRIAESLLIARFREQVAHDAAVADVLERVRERRLDPYAAAATLTGASIGGGGEPGLCP